jgi:hypothetical protein
VRGFTEVVRQKLLAYATIEFKAQKVGHSSSPASPNLRAAGQVTPCAPGSDTTDKRSGCGQEGSTSVAAAK